MLSDSKSSSFSKYSNILIPGIAVRLFVLPMRLNWMYYWYLLQVSIENFSFFADTLHISDNLNFRLQNINEKFYCLLDSSFLFLFEK